MKKALAYYRDRIVVITGGASGIGEQLVRQLANVARATIILDHEAPRAQALADELSGKVVFIPLELRERTAVQETLRDINTVYGDIDLFIHCAGSFMAGEMRDTPVDAWQESFAHNIDPAIYAATSIYEIMRRNGHGHVVVLASAAGLFPVPVMNIYGATKSAVVSLTLGLRLEAEKFDIKVNVVCPTIVDTPLYDRATYAGMSKTKALHYLRHRARVQSPQLAAARILRRIPRNRAVIHTSASTRAAWAVYRLSPQLFLRIAHRFLHAYRRTLRSHPEAE